MNMQNLGLIVLALAIALIGSTPAPAQESNNPCPVGGVPTVACPIINDEVIVANINSRLQGLTPECGCRICVSYNQGVVTLSGYVYSDRQKAVATFLASSVRGVSCVNNQLRVSPVSERDMRLAAEVRQKLSKQTFNIVGINVAVKDGIVDLSGFAQSELAYNMAPIVAESVPGVTAVHNNLIINSPESEIF